MGPSTFDIRLGDALPLTQELDDSYVDAIITSTPWPGRKGGPHPDEFVAWFLPFAIEFKRVLKPTGSMVLNIKEPVKGGERSTCVLSLILALAAMGWRWLDEYPGLTPSPFPSAGPCRLRNGFVRNLHFTKEWPCSFYPNQVRIPIGDWIKREHRLESWMRWDSATGSGFTIRHQNWSRKQFVSPPNVLFCAHESRNYGHPHVYSERVPEFFIRLLTKKGDVVFDPFLGSGTTAVVARRLGRSFLGFERNPAYYEIAKRRAAGWRPGRR